MRKWMYIFCLLFSFHTFSQEINLQQHLIATAGAVLSNSNSTQLSFSIGEPIIYSGMSSSFLYTQGFQQARNGLSYALQMNPTSCEGATDGFIEISNIVGCDAPYQIMFQGEFFSGTLLNNLPVGTHQFTLSGVNCSQNLEAEITQGVGDCSLIFFNGFSPNNDNVNDRWIIQNIESDSSQDNLVDIINRWGVLVWQGKNYDNNAISFTGIDLNGKELPDGTYYYQVRVGDKDYTGFIELLR